MLLLSFPLATAINHNVPAMFIFGDSLADAGNNNFIANTTAKANFRLTGRPSSIAPLVVSLMAELHSISSVFLFSYLFTSSPLVIIIWLILSSD
jgi:hypothetical protein